MKKSLPNRRFARPGEQSQWQQLVKDLVANAKTAEIVDRVNRIELSMSVIPDKEISNEFRAQFNALKAQVSQLTPLKDELRASLKAITEAPSTKDRSDFKDLREDMSVLFRQTQERISDTSESILRFLSSAKNSLPSLAAVEKDLVSIVADHTKRDESYRRSSLKDLRTEVGALISSQAEGASETASKLTEISESLSSDSHPDAKLDKIASSLRTLKTDLSAGKTSPSSGRSLKSNGSIQDSIKELSSLRRSLLGVEGLEDTYSGLLKKSYELMNAQRKEEKDSSRLLRDTAKDVIKSASSKVALISKEDLQFAGAQELRDDLAGIIKAAYDKNSQEFSRLSLKLGDVRNSYSDVPDLLLKKLTAFEDNRKSKEDLAQAKRARRDVLYKKVLDKTVGKLVGRVSELGVGPVTLGRIATAAKLTFKAAIGATSYAADSITRRRALSSLRKSDASAPSNLGDNHSVRTLTNKRSPAPDVNDLLEVLKKKLSKSLAGSSVKTTANSGSVDSPSDSKSSKDEAYKVEERSLFRRQVSLLQTLTRKNKGSPSADSGNSGKVGAIVSSLLGALGLGGLLASGKGLLTGAFKRILTGASRALSGLGSVFLRLLGPVGALTGAASAGWFLGSKLYETFSSEIQNAISSVEGVVKNVFGFFSDVFSWVKRFMNDPMKAISDLGGRIKEEWKNSDLGKYLSNAGALVGETFDSAKKTAKSGVDRAKEAGGKAVNAASEGLSSAKTALVSTYDSSVAAASSAIDTGVSTASSASKFVAGAVGSAVDSGVSAAQSVKSSVVNTYQSMKDAAGKLFRTSGNVNLDGVQPSVSRNFASMAADYKAMGGRGNIQVNSAFRSDEEQAKLYAQNPRRAAPPGRSSHGKGLAVDINSKEANELDSMGLLSKYGFSRPVKNEPWHLQAAGMSRPLSASGIYSADSPDNQTSSSSSVSRSAGSSEDTTAPLQKKLDAREDLVPQGRDQSIGYGSAGNNPSAGSVSSANSTATIPTFSFNDGGFFVMNAGMFAS